MASIMPEPHIPDILWFLINSENSVSFDQLSQPITLKIGSLVIASILTFSIAPGAALWPDDIWAPSKAGPVGEEQANNLFLFPKISSAFVPTSIIRMFLWLW